MLKKTVMSFQGELNQATQAEVEHASENPSVEVRSLSWVKPVVLTSVLDDFCDDCGSQFQAHWFLVYIYIKKKCSFNKAVKEQGFSVQCPEDHNDTEIKFRMVSFICCPYIK